MKVAYLIEPPFNFLDASGAVTGCDIELARYVFNQLGIEDVTFVETEFAQLMPGLACDDWQMTTGLFASPERQQHALFSRPIWALPDGLLIRTADGDRIMGYRSLGTSADLQVAVIRDQLQHPTALALGVPPDRFLVFDTYANAAHAVQIGKAHAFASVARAHLGFLQQSDAHDFAIVEIPPDEKPAAFGCFGFAHPATKLRDRVDRALDQFIGGSQHRQLMKRFGFEEEEVDLLGTFGR
ncbi:transporter substrate-binding domain-containing protein [Yoonia sp. 2307UL14-13]|uniref:transporter substrate-binding domain-containing protein n=1 Tax=Yoonia sp. 2307UL14-13 TaxID=3126506 RepID=UPI0030A31E59